MFVGRLGIDKKNRIYNVVPLNIAVMYFQPIKIICPKLMNILLRKDNASGLRKLSTIHIEYIA